LRASALKQAQANALAGVTMDCTVMIDDRVACENLPGTIDKL
jgi:hypothetical protein